MKVLLKKEFCESREQCMGSTRTQLTLLSKKKKGETQTNADTANIISTQSGTKCTMGQYNQEPKLQ